VGRDPRTIDPDSIYHTVTRGNNRQPIVWNDGDRRLFVREFDKVARRFDWAVYAWCLMTNHHHVVLRTNEPAFSRGFQQLNGNHSRRMNRLYGRSDHLFRNRPTAVQIETLAHLVGALAYVVRNPIAADVCDRADEYIWSSYRATMGLDPAPPWLCVDDVLRLFGTTVAAARAAFDELVHRGRLPVSDTAVTLV
jgi:REP-associated tyrosine transposase